MWAPDISIPWLAAVTSGTIVPLLIYLCTGGGRVGGKGPSIPAFSPIPAIEFEGANPPSFPAFPHPPASYLPEEVGQPGDRI